MFQKLLEHERSGNVKSNSLFHWAISTNEIKPRPINKPRHKLNARHKINRGLLQIDCLCESLTSLVFI